MPDDVGQGILTHLGKEGAVLTGRHFIYTNGGHGPAYVNMRNVAHQSYWLRSVARHIAEKISSDIDVVIGPETLGRTFAELTAAQRPDLLGIWCHFEGKGSEKHAAFAEKADFGRLIKGKRVVIVDDLLTTGSSIKQTADLVLAYGGIPVLAIAVVRRTPDVTNKECGVPKLIVLADVPGFVVFATQADCEAHGPCSQIPPVPVALLPGHGHEWVKDNPDYPVEKQPEATIT